MKYSTSRLQFTLIWLALLCFSAWSHSTTDHHHRDYDHDHDDRDCGFEADPDVFDNLQTEIAKINLGGDSVEGDRRRLQGGAYQIGVVFHLLQGTTGNSAESLAWNDAARINQEIANLNSKYSNSPFTFVLRKFQVTVNDAWAFGNPAFDQALGDTIGSALREGGPTVVNIFVGDFSMCSAVGANGITIKGLARFYNSEEVFPQDTFSREDRVFVCGDAGPDTVPHEVGHWNGLLHTFAGNSCNPVNRNDLVDDTPQQLSETRNCPASEDSCPQLAGSDPINNLMNYGSCSPKVLTAGQVERLQLVHNVLRQQVEPCQTGFARLDITVKFDSTPQQTLVSYVPWGTTFQFQINLKNDIEPQVDYTNASIQKVKCVPANAVHEVIITDPDGLQASGYYSVNINNIAVVLGSAFSQEMRVFVAGGDEVCANGQRRIQIDVTFGNQPNAITWSIAAVNGLPLLDSSSSYVLNESGYNGRFAGKKLFVNACAADNTYVVTVNNNLNVAQPGFEYQVKVDNVVKLTGGAGLIGSESQQVEVAEPPPPPNFGTICFAGSSMVHVLGAGMKQLKDVKIGDKVSVGNGKFEPIYSFAHYSPREQASFVEIKTNESTLMLSRDHMVFVKSLTNPVPASNLSVGDKLMGASEQTTLVVESITSVVSGQGVFAPFTPSGKIVVDGVLASSFIGFESRSVLTIFGVELSYQWLARSFESPHRLVCLYLSECPGEQYDASGISLWIAMPHRMASWLLEQNQYLKAAVLCPLLVLLACFNAVEYLLVFPRVLVVAGIVVALVCCRTKRSAKLVQ